MAAFTGRVFSVQIFRTRPVSHVLKSYSSSSEDRTHNDQETKEQTKVAKKKAQDASEKLTRLLSELKVQPQSGKEVCSDLNFKLARPQNRLLQPRERRKQDTLFDLKMEEKERFHGIEEPMAKAIKSVASSVGGDATRTESELIHMLRSYKEETDKAKSNSNISDIISGMTIEKNNAASDAKKESLYTAGLQTELEGKSRSSFSKLEAGLKSTNWKPQDLFGGKPLGLFKKKEHEDQKSQSKTMWDRCEERELRHLLLAPPANAFEEMIRWTEEGKLWKYPIDNEQGLEKEQSVPFHEHVFLERHLKDGFPETGPIRHFMELVCVGLSKNSFITANRKLEHIQWFRDYFQMKREVLENVEIVSQ